MQKRKMKIIASMLILVLTLAHVNVIGQVIAISLEDQLTTTNNANVEFDAYFKNETGKEHSTTKKISDENYVYTAINVKNVGYLKDAVVTLENANFEILESLNNKQVSKVETNKLYLNKIDNGNTVEIAIPIQMPYEEKIALEQFGKESKVNLTAIYVDGNGKENTVQKDITVALAWTEEKQAELSVQVTKFIPYAINENKGVLLQTLVQSYLKDNTLPVKQNKIEISVPTINGIKPQEVKVLANTTKATNGDITGENVTQENYTYDSENNKLTIAVNNELDENQKISWQKEAQDEFLVTYIYPEKEIVEDGVNVEISANSEITIYEASQTKATKTFTGEVTLKEQISNLVDFSIVTNIESISKGQIYANYDAQNKIETEYQENVTANISLANLIDKITLEEKGDNLILSDETKLKLAEKYYKTITLNKQEIIKILGENGEVYLYNGETKIATINKEITSNLDGRIILDLSKANINNLKIETSKPITEGNINISIVKATKAEAGLTKAQMRNVSKLELNLTGKAVNGTETIVEQALTKEITFTEPTSQAELVIDNSNLSTIVTNENVRMTAILKTDSLNCKLYKNPTLQITLPNYIENINIKNIEVLFDTENSKLTLKSHQIVPNSDGTKTILINLEGIQTEYTLGAVSKGVNVIITSDITVNKFTANKQDQIKMVYTNNDEINNVIETNEITSQINIVAPVGIITTSTISNYAENAENITSISGEEKIATIPISSEARNANLSMEVINNYNNTIDNISILGRTAFKGNKEILTGADLGTTTNMPLTSNITVEGVDASKVTIYYSENANATKDISLASNAWTQTPASLENVKSYLIVLTDYTMNTADKISFNYTMQIPENMQHNESAYENYVVYFNNNLETGTIQDKQASTKVGVTTGKGAVIEASMSSNIAETEEVLTDNIIKYTLTVKNIGTETAENVVATIDLPEGLQHVELEEGSTTDYNVIAVQGQTQINLGNIEANKTVTKEILMKVGILSSTEDTKEVEVKAKITSDNIEVETQPIKNTLARTYFIITPTILKENDVLKENESYTYYMEVLASNLDETRQETVLTVKLPEEIVFESVQIKNKIKNEQIDITESIIYSYDSKTRILTINLGDVDGKNIKAISLKVKVGTLAEGVYDKEVNIEATASAKDARTQKAIIEPVQIGKIGFKITQSSNIPENTHITANEDLKYIFTIENLSNVDLYNVEFTDILPEELTLNHMKLTRESGNTTNSYKNTMQINLKGREKVTLEVNVSVNIIDETKTVSNKATIKYEGIDTITTSSYKHVVEKFETADFDDGNNDPSNPTNPSNTTKRIMGTIWIDANANGQRDENEEKVPNVEMLLFNNVTGKLVTDATGKVLRTTTNENGAYTFAGIKQGKYTVIFLYDTANYSATTYRKENVDASMNSDAVDSKITLDGITRVAAITEEVAVTDSNIYNIDLGLVSNPKFDLKLDKTVSKITVQDATGTNVYEFNDSKLAKKDLVGKQIAGTTIIVEYKIKVSNEGAISGFVKKIADYMPKEMKFNSELNKDWYTSESGVLYNSSLANTIINPGESKVVTLTLTKKMTEDNLGLYHNEAEIYEAYNDLGIEDIDSTPGNKLSSEDDISSADVLITVKTGEVIIFAGLALTTIVIIGIGIYFIKKKVIK